MLTKKIMAKSILCPIDFSESSLEALKWATELSSMLNCHLSVLYPYRLLQTSKNDVTDLKKKNEEQAAKKFAAVEKSHLKGKDISFDFSAEVGFLDDRVEYHLKKNHILMMVISKSMNNRNKENPEDFIDQSDVPVLVVP